MRWKTWLVAGVPCAFALIAGTAKAEQFVRIGSGLAGSYPVFGAKLAELFNQHVPGVRASTFAAPTGQSLVKLQRGEAEAVLSYTFESQRARLKGENALKTPAPDLRHLMTTYGATHVALARTGVEISSLADLAKKPYRVWLGSKTSVFWPLNLAALQAHGVTPDDIVKAGGVINSAGYGTLDAGLHGRTGRRRVHVRTHALQHDDGTRPRIGLSAAAVQRRGAREVQ